MKFLIALSFLLVASNGHANFFDELFGTHNSCKDPEYKKLFDAVMNSTNPDHNIWTYKRKADGKLYMETNPNKWFTKNNKEELYEMCFEARKSWGASNLDYNSPGRSLYMCGHLVYSCDFVSSGVGNRDQNDKGSTDEGTEGDNGSDPDDNYGDDDSGDQDDNFGDDPDDNFGDDQDDNFGDGLPDGNGQDDNF